MKPVVAAAAAATIALLAGCGSSGSAGPAPQTSTTAPGSPSAPTVAASPADMSPTSVQAVLAPWRLPLRLSRAVLLDGAGQTLLAGGLMPGDRSSDQVLAVDPVRGSARPAGRLAQAAHDSAGGVVAGRPFLFGGGGATELSTIQQGGGSSWKVVGHLPGGTRSDLSVVDLGGSLLLLGGYDGSTTPTSMLRTTDGTHFTVVGHLPSGVRYAGVARIGTVVWVLGGETNQQELTEVYRIDTTTGQVQTVGRMPGPLGHEAVIPVGRRLLVLGGRTAVHSTTSAMWWFDTQTHRWTHAGRLPEPVADTSALVRGNQAWLLGGEAPDYTDAVVQVSWR